MGANNVFSWMTDSQWQSAQNPNMPAAQADNFSPGSNYRQAPGQRPGVEFGSPGGMMPPQNLAGIAEQSQQMANNPIYGQGSPFQPPMAMTRPTPITNPNASIGFGPVPIDQLSGGGKSMPGMMPTPQPIVNPGQQPLQGTPIQGSGQMIGGPVDRPIIGNQPPMQNRGQMIGGPVDRPIFGGGLRPTPRNYRPPMRQGGILRQRMR